MKYLKFKNVDIYYTKISNKKSYLKTLTASLSEDELIKANSFYTSTLKNNYIICRGLLRSSLSKYINISPHKILFKYNSYGKPELSNAVCKTDIKFNISHSGDYFLVALNNKYEIGVDIEEIKPIKDFMSIAKRFYSVEEFKKIKNIRDFYTIWSQKEALIKASGKGLSFGFNHWSTKIEDDYDIIVIDSKRYLLSNLNIDNNYSSAICIMTEH